MATIRKPKYKKNPKAPKAGASLETLKRYEKRVDEVAKDNQAKKKEYNAKISKREADKKAKTSIRDRAKKKLEKAKA